MNYLTLSNAGASVKYAPPFVTVAVYTQPVVHSFTSLPSSI
jgi:hypothetical protein